MHTRLLLPLALFGTVLLASCSNGKKQAQSQAIDSVYQAGKLKPTDTLIKHTFYIKNTGNADLLIDSVGGSCNCINLNWQKTPVKPGDNGFINVTVASDTSEVKGNKSKQIIVKTNAARPFSVYQVNFTR